LAVFHGSTVLYPTAEDLHAHRAEFSYGRHGSPTTLRLHIGLENVDDLKADLERGFAALKAAA
jgi:cystathionine beta-lyase/cystathionine gamma-synthase